LINLFNSPWHNEKANQNEDVISFFQTGPYISIVGEFFPNHILYFGLIKNTEEIKEGTILDITWTDDKSSLGSEVGKVHFSKIRVVSNDRLEIVSDKYLDGSNAKGSFCKPAWIRP